MTIDEVTGKIKSLAETHAGRFEGTANFQFEDGIVHLDDTVSPPVVSNEEKDAPFTIVMSAADFGQIITGDLNVMMAFMTGKLKIKGDKGAAMKLTSLF
ncbi:MAG: SCP2 sterol-binding domain-containing protein [Cyclobacteriaceae bacterium]